MDEFLSTPSAHSNTAASRHMNEESGPESPGTLVAETRCTSTQMEQITTSMFTKADVGALETSLKHTIRGEVTAIRQNVTALQGRVSALETAGERSNAPHGTPRDVVCMHSFRQKERIMNRAREHQTWHFRNANVSPLCPWRLSGP
ncbi:Hypothetical predicted protein [Pelobates cultripes]|uniref:Uncharacterized protein n=1 Tax=Pelobates cultripes TaxID=61616 RepID=A0AAD1VVE5_PELCU|nr:Hypothetical predicted protein [Pelobates cultripes]